jgi:site-specific DNA-methyltransferase (adenine-specific)
MDAVFGATYFLNEIIWKRKTGRGETQHKSNRFGTSTDILLFYSKAGNNIFNSQFNFEAAGYQDYIENFYRHVDENGRRYRIADLSSPSPRPNLTYEYKGYKPPKTGWAISRAKMGLWDKEGRLYFPKNQEGRIQRKRFLDELKGKPVQNLWDDIEMISSQSNERLGYPTQKPEALLERIIKASSNEGDHVLDPFCGCGTTIAVAQKLKRRWTGIDITHLAITLMKKRLLDAFGTEAKCKVIGEPTSLPDAKALAESDPYQFQWWALGLVEARPVEEKKGADKGIDGKIVFQGERPGDFEQVVISVKAGHVTPNHVRDLRGVVEREKAAIGILISMDEPTKPMLTEAATAGFFESKTWGRKYPRVQLLTIADLLSGKKVDMPPIKQVSATFKKAERFKGDKSEQLELKNKEQ